MKSRSEALLLAQAARRCYLFHTQYSHWEVITVEHVIQLHIERLPEGAYRATSDEVQGLVAQGRTIQETIEIARDVAKKLIEAQSDSSLFDLGASRERTDIARDKDKMIGEAFWSEHLRGVL